MASILSVCSSERSTCRQRSSILLAFRHVFYLWLGPPCTGHIETLWASKQQAPQSALACAHRSELHACQVKHALGCCIALAGPAQHAAPVSPCKVELEIPWCQVWHSPQRGRPPIVLRHGRGFLRRAAAELALQQGLLCRAVRIPQQHMHPGTHLCVDDLNYAGLDEQLGTLHPASEGWPAAPHSSQSRLGAPHCRASW